MTIGILQNNYVAEQSENHEGGPLIMNAFEMITLSQGLNLSALFDRGQVELSTIPEVHKCLWSQHMEINLSKS